MTEVQHCASLHEKTIQQVAAGSLDLPKQPRQQPRTLATTMHRLKVNPVLWAEVRDLVGGDMSRVEIVSETEVIIR